MFRYISSYRFLFLLFLITIMTGCNAPSEQENSYTYQIRLKASDINFNNQIIDLQKKRLMKIGIPEDKLEIEIQKGELLFILRDISIEKSIMKKIFMPCGSLEFWNTYRNEDIYPFLEEINKTLFLLQSQKEAKDTIVLEDSSMQDSTSLSLVDQVAKEEEEENRKNAKKTDPLFAVLIPSMMEVENGYSPRPGPVIGYVYLKDTSIVNAYLQMPEVQKCLPKNCKLLWSYQPFDKENPALMLIAVKDRGRRNFITGDIVQDARKIYADNMYSISLIMTKEARDSWEEFTGMNVGESIAMVLNNKVLSYPTVKGKITGGHSSIKGDFGSEEIDEIIYLLKAGALPFDLTIVSENIIND